MDVETGVVGVFAVVAAIVVAFGFILYLVPLRLWTAAWASGVYIGMARLVARSPTPSGTAGSA
jgi:uncharacterized protein YqfA (UPF0365 family)